MQELDEECRELLRWYEARWLEDRDRWQEEKNRLQARLEALDKSLREERLSREAEIARIRSDYDALLQQREEAARKAKEEREQCAKALEEALARLEVAQHPPLGEGFFRRLAQEQSLWDQKLLEKARSLQDLDLARWMGEEWSWRSRALLEASKGHPIDWRRLWTGLVLEWGLWAWLEGQGSGEEERSG